MISEVASGKPSEAVDGAAREPENEVDEAAASLANERESAAQAEEIEHYISKWDGQIQAFCTARGLTLEKLARDGDCFFRALSYCSSFQGRSADEIRQGFVDFFQNPANAENKLIKEMADHNALKVEYIRERFEVPKRSRKTHLTHA